MIEKRLKEIEERKKEIRSLLEKDDELDLEKIQEELRSLDEEKEKLEKRAQIAKGIQSGGIVANPIVKPKGEAEERKFEGMERDEILSAPEYRSGYLKRLQGKPLTAAEERALTTASDSAGAAVPTQTLNMIVDKLRQTSALFPWVNVSYVPVTFRLWWQTPKTPQPGNPKGQTVHLPMTPLLRLTWAGTN